MPGIGKVGNLILKLDLTLKDQMKDTSEMSCDQ